MTLPKRCPGRPPLPLHQRLVPHTVRLRPDVSDAICRLAIRERRSVYSVLAGIVTAYIDTRTRLAAITGRLRTRRIDDPVLRRWTVKDRSTSEFLLPEHMNQRQ